MRGKLVLCLLLLCVFVGIVSADTLIIYQTVGTNDARIYRSVTSEDYTTLRNSAGTNMVNSESATTMHIRASTTSNQYNQLSRVAIIFDTSGLDDAATITSAKLSVRQSSTAPTNGLGTMAIGVTRFNINGTLSSDDYNNYELERFADDIPYASWQTAKYNNWTLNSLAISNISKTGNTGFYIRQATDIDNTSPTWSSGAKNEVVLNMADASEDPILTIDYTLGDSTPPASITGLGNTTTCNSINWTWTDSESVDADVVQIYQNGTFLHNVSANQTYDLWSSLAESLEYTFSSHTCDLSKNCNTTWVNQSAQTLDCSGPGPITGLAGDPDCDSIEWTWTDPVDADLLRIMVYKDGIWLKNVSPGTETDTFTSLSESTEYTFSGRTVDTSENLGSWTNLSKTTDPCGYAPVADFSTNKSGSICAGEYIQFTDESSNIPTSWYWEFGDGNTSVEQNPVFQYNVFGITPDVNFKATNAYGSSWHNETDLFLVNDCSIPPTPTPPPYIPNPIRQDRGQLIDLITWILNLFRSKLV